MVGEADDKAIVQVQVQCSAVPCSRCLCGG